MYNKFVWFYTDRPDRPPFLWYEAHVIYVVIFFTIKLTYCII